MPLYDFHCKRCQKNWEDLRDFQEVSPCPSCGKPGERLLPRRVLARYRGKGFYSTDYK